MNSPFAHPSIIGDNLSLLNSPKLLEFLLEIGGGYFEKYVTNIDSGRRTAIETL